MNRIFAHLPIFLITVTCTLGIGQPYTTGEHSYTTEVEVGWYCGWRGTSNKQKNVAEFMVILPEPHNVVSIQFDTLQRLDVCPDSDHVYSVSQIHLILEWVV